MSSVFAPRKRGPAKQNVRRSARLAQKRMKKAGPEFDITRLPELPMFNVIDQMDFKSYQNFAQSSPDCLRLVRSFKRETRRLHVHFVRFRMEYEFEFLRKSSSEWIYDKVTYQKPDPSEGWAPVVDAEHIESFLRIARRNANFFNFKPDCIHMVSELYPGFGEWDEYWKMVKSVDHFSIMARYVTDINWNRLFSNLEVRRYFSYRLNGGPSRNDSMQHAYIDHVANIEMVVFDCAEWYTDAHLLAANHRLLRIRSHNITTQGVNQFLKKWLNSSETKIEQVNFYLGTINFDATMLDDIDFEVLQEIEEKYWRFAFRSTGSRMYRGGTKLIRKDGSALYIRWYQCFCEMSMVYPGKEEQWEPEPHYYHEYTRRTARR